MIISIGYRVKSLRGIQFRIWANKVLKEYLLKGYAINHRFEQIEKDVQGIKNKLNEIDFQIKTSLPPNEGIFYDGQVYDAYVFIGDLIKNAKKHIVLIDNYIDDSVLTLLSKRQKKVSALIYTANINKQFSLDIRKYKEQYPAIELKTFKKSHDRFLIIDNERVYHIGASLKDLGKRWFAFSKIDINIQDLLKRLND